MVTEVKQFVNPPEEVINNKFNIIGYSLFYLFLSFSIIKTNIKQAIKFKKKILYEKIKNRNFLFPVS